MKSTILLATLLVTAYALASKAPNSDSTPSKNVPGRDANATSAATADLTYVIGTEDVLMVSVWREPELTTTLPVRSDGKISLPLVSDVTAAGLTPMALAASLREKFKKYVDDPRVTVVVTQMNHQRVFVIGEVLRHGPISLLPGMTVLQALATSGIGQFANTKRIYVLRNTNGAQEKLPVNYKQLIKGEDMNQNILLKAGDTIVVP